MRLIIFHCFLLFSLSVEAQVHKFSVEVGGKKVGTLTASLDQKGDEQTIHVISDANIKLLWKNYGRKTYFMNHFLGKKLMESHAITYYNDELEDSVILKSGLKDYRCFQYPDKNITIRKEEIKVTTSNLFFNEPSNIDSVYSERYLEFCQLKKSKNGQYELHLPDGSVNNYTYNDHQLEEILIDRPWVNVRIKKMN